MPVGHQVLEKDPLKGPSAPTRPHSARETGRARGRTPQPFGQFSATYPLAKPERPNSARSARVVQDSDAKLLTKEEIVSLIKQTLTQTAASIPLRQANGTAARPQEEDIERIAEAIQSLQRPISRPTTAASGALVAASTDGATKTFASGLTYDTGKLRKDGCGTPLQKVDPYAVFRGQHIQRPARVRLSHERPHFSRPAREAPYAVLPDDLLKPPPGIIQRHYPIKRCLKGRGLSNLRMGNAVDKRPTSQSGSSTGRAHGTAPYGCIVGLPPKFYNR